ncbi:DUF6333 family protein [Streptomyces sp. NPDC057438]|uniref:DUF6333 family protein n=1 Tax=Streptomyces sp. NPDC057438 TaxID=3346133 RepID=UPI0036CD7EE4
MTEDTFWNVPEDHEVVRYGEFFLTVIRAPLPGGSAVLPAHDPARAREFVYSFGTVDAVREELAPVSATDAVGLATRADLDIVRVGCWGAVTEVVDPALGNTGDDVPLWECAAALRERYPDAAVIGAATVEHHVTYGAWAIAHPDGPAVLNPDQPDTIMDSTFASTDAGRVLLEADLRLKHDFYKALDPKTEVGERAWAQMARRDG